MRWLTLCLAITLCSTSLVFAGETADIPLADGFDFPVGKGEGTGYYKARGMKPHGHLGEDWNGVGGGDTDLGDPVTATADGIVLFAQDFRMGWGNVVIIRHAYLEGADIKFADSLYGHLNEIKTTLGAIVRRGQLIGTIGTAHGLYSAHLHFEMRKDLRVGMYRSSFPQDYTVYWDPTQFVLAHRKCAGDRRIVAAPVNTFPTENNPPPAIAAAPRSSALSPGAAASPKPDTPAKSPVRRGSFTIDRFEDLRKLGY